MAEVETLMKAMIKYLPVEGIPKEGDIITNVKGTLRGHKFFAVTFDIKPGDIITNISKSTMQTTIGPLYSYTLIGKFFCYLYNFFVYNLFEIRRVKNITLSQKDLITRRLAKGDYLENYKKWFKVLGEVSPEATFVEDGKEYKIERGMTTETSLNSGTKKRYYRILCPKCRHLH